MSWIPNKKEGKGLTFVVEEAQAGDVGKGVARIYPDKIEELGLKPADVVELTSGASKTVARIMHIDPSSNMPANAVRIDGMIRENVGAGIEDLIDLKKAETKVCETLLISPTDPNQPPPGEDEAQQLAMMLAKRPVITGDKVEVQIFGLGSKTFLIEGTSPQGPVIINPSTLVRVKKSDAGEKAARVSYEDIGGLDDELKKIREIVEYPMRYPAIFQKLGIEPLKGVLMIGPSGVGKTLIARAVANEVKARFMHIDGPEVMNKFYGESEAKLRQIFVEAATNAPAIIFIDEIDAICPKRTETQGNVEKRVVAQLLVLLDGLKSRGQVIVIGATNIPNMLDPALRRPGRFDREIIINPANRVGRHQILKIHTRKMPLAENVDLERLAELSHGFVGSDLAALCKEAGMVTLRRVLGKMREEGINPTDADYSAVTVEQADFLSAFRETEPSAMREFLPERPKIKLKDVGGLHEVKKNLSMVMDICLGTSAEEKDTKAILPRGFFFAGAPGTGKTMFAKALAGEFELPVLTVNSSALYSKYIGESEKGIAEVFKKAKHIAPCILLLDEVDTLAPTRSAISDSGIGQRVVNQLAVEIDKAVAFQDIIIIATTNRIDLVDTAMLRSGRFDYVVEFEVPTESERLEILQLTASDLDIDEATMKELAKNSRGMTGADIESCVRKVRMIRASSAFKSGGKEMGKKQVAEEFVKAVADMGSNIKLAQRHIGLEE
ncbi:MAG: AAA family ATPase [Deltaproteobacteria bacterium]|nr:AAA family ATPase [Deltaproteobacteria bacterium]